MPPRENTDANNRSRQRPRTQPGSRTQSSAQRITFVDSRDPNVRSTIQRHTAHHTNQQRRDARLQSLRTNNRPRVLEWQRRFPSNDHSGASTPTTTSAATTTTTSSASSPASVSVLSPSQMAISEPATPPIVHDDYRSTLAGLVEHSPNYDQGEEELRQSCEIQPPPLRHHKTNQLQVLNFVCPYAEDPDIWRQVVRFAERDRASSILVSAYVICLRVFYHQSVDPDIDHNRARVYLIRGTALLMNRLSDSSSASSDENIQAVLLLIAITTDFQDFGNPGEAMLHRDALRTMLAERGGATSLPPILQIQATSLETSRTHHLTLGCSAECETAFRFES